jgi:methylated-DNA-[protein]-cysteine S-methyltransferase
VSPVGGGPSSPVETLRRSELDSPIGRLHLVTSDAGLVYLSLPRASGRGFASWRERHAPAAALRDAGESHREWRRHLCEYLEGGRTRFDLPLDLRATPFQLAVYEALAKIPYGETRSYSEVAAVIGRPDASRAVGAASGANPTPLVIPCHRVIAKSGRLQGYAGGVRLQARLLAMEQQARSEQGRLV